MKISNLRAKFKPKRHKGNIHFGKFVLTFMLVCMMILGNVEPVKASEPLYYYDKYELLNIFSDTVEVLDNERINLTLEDDKEHLKYSSGSFFRDYRLDTKTNEYIGIDPLPSPVKISDAVGNYYVYTEVNPNYPILSRTKVSRIDRFVEVYRNPDSWLVHFRAYSLKRDFVRKEKGNLISKNIIGTASQYPADGVHTDGYWYVRGSLVTPGTPTSITVPTSNLKVGNSFTVTWGTSSNAQGYELERSINGGSYNKIYTGTLRSYTDIVQSNWNTVTYRVRGYNGTSYSSYRTSPTRAVAHNSPPTTPSSITVPRTIQGGESFTVSWGASTDPDGDSITYILERQVNGFEGGWTQIYTGSDRSYLDTALPSWNTVMYRVRAYDGKAYSDYKTSIKCLVTHYSIEISSPSEDSYFGKKVPINISGTVKDTDSGDTLTIKYTISGITAHTNKTLRTITANGNDQSFSNDIPIDTSIPEGSYDLYVWVENNRGGKSNATQRRIYVDKTLPELTITGNTKEWVNHDIILTIYGNDVGIISSGIKGIRTPDDYWYSQTISYLVTKNGSYTFEAEDKVGNITTKTINITNIDKEKPKLHLELSTDNYTNEDVVITAKASDSHSGILEIELPDGRKVANSEATYTVNENGTYTFKAFDKAGNVATESIEVKNIDKFIPIVKIDEKMEGSSSTKIDEKMRKHTKDIDVVVYVKGGLSQISRVEYSITESISGDNLDWVPLNVSYDGDIYKGNIKLSDINKQMYVHVRAISNAGNVGQGYRGIYRINSPLKISNLRIKDDDPGLMDLEENPIKIGGINAYVLKKNNFGNRYEVDIIDRDEDPIKLQYVVKKDNKEYSKGYTNFNGGKGRVYEFNVNYFKNRFFDTWDDGVYEVEVTGKDYDGEIKEENFMSESKDSVYVLIKRNAPPQPKIIYDESQKIVTIDFPKESGLFDNPDIMKYYKKQYFINDRGLEDWVGEPIKIDKNCTITALYTDIAGNTSKDVLNIVYKPKVGGGNNEGNLDVLVEETRSSKKYFINTRRDSTGKLDETKLDFLQKFRKE